MLKLIVAALVLWANFATQTPGIADVSWIAGDWQTD
jgi:hypothetical protein